MLLTVLHQIHHPHQLQILQVLTLGEEQLILIQMIHLAELILQTLHQQIQIQIRILPLQIQILTLQLQLLTLRVHTHHLKLEKLNLILRRMNRRVTQEEILILKQKMEEVRVMKEEIHLQIKKRVILMRKVKNPPKKRVALNQKIRKVMRVKNLNLIK